MSDPEKKKSCSLFSHLLFPSLSVSSSLGGCDTKRRDEGYVRSGRHGLKRFAFWGAYYYSFTHTYLVIPGQAWVLWLQPLGVRLDKIDNTCTCRPGEYHVSFAAAKCCYTASSSC
ncbi:hypothetical protein LX36DRAFT_66910 [Colletotrichum falcatum]|nr:hypothetical protein LX36DRAFT_66910 [Colletotrichum falcatum]